MQMRLLANKIQPFYGSYTSLKQQQGTDNAVNNTWLYLTLLADFCVDLNSKQYHY